MATRLRRTLFVGLGGTGLETLLHIKRRFVETYDEIPPMFGFLAVDTDRSGGGIQKIKNTNRKKYPVVKFEANETCLITVSNPKEIFLMRRDEFSWIPENSSNALINLDNGAGQVRTNGRFGLMCNIPEFEQKLQAQIAKITNHEIINNTQYTILNEDIEIYVVASIAGGTGCGTFIDTGYIIKDMVEKMQGKFKVFAYLFMPQVYKQMIGLDPTDPKSANVNPNAYGALVDLDFLMHVGLNNPIFLKTPTGTRKFDTPPFSAICLIDNRDQAGNTYNHINMLEEMAAVALTLGVSDFANATSVMDNVITYMTTGNMNVKNKQAWASGMGVCEIVVDGTALANIYGKRYAARVLQGLLNTCDDTTRLANIWIDSPEVNIRENDGDTNNNLIDQLMDPHPKYPLGAIADNSNPAFEIDEYIKNVAYSKEELSSKTKEIEKRVIAELKKFLIEQTNNDCGVGNVLGIIDELTRQSNNFLKEMLDESEEHLIKKEKFIITRKSLEENLKDTAKSFNPFNKKGRIEEAEEELCNIIYQSVINDREIARKQEAQKILSVLLESLNKYSQQFGELRNKLNTLIKDFLNDAASIANSSNGSDKAFIIELKDRYTHQIEVKDSDINTSDFLRKLKTKTVNGLYDFISMNEELIADHLWEIAGGVKETIQWRNITIEEALNSMSPTEIETLFNRAVQKSSLLFNYDHRGYVINPIVNRTFSVGLPDANNSIVRKSKLVEKHVTGSTPVDYTTTNMKDRVVIYRQVSALPAYTLSAFESCKVEYNHKKEYQFFNIDLDWYNIMERKGFTLLPEADKDNNKIELWVQAILHDFIVNDNGVYKIKSQSLGDPIDAFWYTLAKDNFRDDAFDAFSRNFSSYQKELKEKITDKIKRMGEDKYSKFISQVKGNDSEYGENAYLDHFSKINIDRKELKERGNEKISDLIRKEIEYIMRVLV